METTECQSLSFSVKFVDGKETNQDVGERKTDDK